MKEAKFWEKLNDEENMNKAFILAKEAYKNEEIPIGCIIVDKDNNVIATSKNEKQKLNNSLMHAEIIALNLAMEKLNTKYLQDYCMYVTLEPCAMCAGALVNARVGRLVYGVKEPKTGCCGSKFNLIDGQFNHTVEQKDGFLEMEIKKLLSDFFKERR